MSSMEQQLRIQLLANELAQISSVSPDQNRSGRASDDKAMSLVIKIGSLALGSYFNKTYMHIVGIVRSLLALLSAAPAAASAIPHRSPSFLNAVCRTLKYCLSILKETSLWELRALHHASTPAYCRLQVHCGWRG